MGNATRTKKDVEMDPKETALLIVDMQNDFVLQDAPIRTEGGLHIVSNIQRLIGLARGKSIPVIFTQEVHRRDLSDFGIELDYEPIHCLDGSGGAEFVKGLEPQEGDYLITNKRRYDAFLDTDLQTLLRSLHVRALLVSGVCTDICVMATVLHARHLDYRVWILEDCTAGTSAERHQAALLCMSHVFGKVVSLKDLERALEAKVLPVR